jgi:hypothetical protein
MFEGGEGDSPRSARKPLTLSLTPQNYSRGQDKARVQRLHKFGAPCVGGGGLDHFLDFVPGCVWT